MMELTQDVWWCLFVTHLAARRWTFSIVFMLFAECGSQTVAEYSRIGRTKALYALLAQDTQVNVVCFCIGPVSGSRYMARLRATGADRGLDTRIKL